MLCFLWKSRVQLLISKLSRLPLQGVIKDRDIHKVPTKMTAEFIGLVGEEVLLCWSNINVCLNWISRFLGCFMLFCVLFVKYSLQWKTCSVETKHLVDGLSNVCGLKVEAPKLVRVNLYKYNVYIYIHTYVCSKMGRRIFFVDQANKMCLYMYIYMYIYISGSEWRLILQLQLNEKKSGKTKFYSIPLLEVYQISQSSDLGHWVYLISIIDRWFCQLQTSIYRLFSLANCRL